jgi:hypothetical protein
MKLYLQQEAVENAAYIDHLIKQSASMYTISKHTNSSFLDRTCELKTVHSLQKEQVLNSVYKLCDSSSGYMWNFIVYTGKDIVYVDKHPGEQNSSQTVLELANNLLDKGYCLYLKN